MKYLFTIAIMCLMVGFASAQGDSKWPDLDKSIMETAYYPANVAWRNYLTPEERNLAPQLKVTYSRPKMNGRKIFGELIAHGDEWRLGANEATLLTFYQGVRIGDKSLGAGTYSLFATPSPSEWTFFISTETGIWGNANRDASKTVATITVPTSKITEPREALSMAFQEIDDMTAHLVIEWENTRAALPINFNPINFTTLDVSPLDMAHYPDKSAYTNYMEGDDKNIKPKIQVTYSRPAKKGRDIFGDLLKDTKVWRVGANEATEIALYQDVKIGETEIGRGRYALFAELNGDSWNLIFSKDFPIWGAHERDITKDVVKVKVGVTQEEEVVENLSIIFDEKSAELVHMIIAWDKTRAAVPITLK